MFLLLAETSAAAFPEGQSNELCKTVEPGETVTFALKDAKVDGSE